MLTLFREKEKALSKLRRMHIVTEKNAVLTLDPTFRISFRRALTGGGDHRSFGVPCTTVDKHKVDVSFLDKYATEQWETILHFMVGNKTEKKPSDGVIKLLVSSGLMAKSCVYPCTYEGGANHNAGVAGDQKLHRLDSHSYYKM